MVKLDRPLDRGIADDVAVGEVLSNNACARLLLLRDLVGVPLSISGWVLGIDRGRAARRLDGDVGRAQLGVVQEEGSLGGSLLLEGDGRRLGIALRLDVEAGNLAAGRAVRYASRGTSRRDRYLPEAEEVADLLVVGATGDILDVHSCGRHDEDVEELSSGVRTVRWM